MVVSHDRYFMDTLVDHLFVFKGNGEIKDFNGTYVEYRMKRRAETEQARSQQKNEAPPETAAAVPLWARAAP